MSKGKAAKPKAKSRNTDLTTSKERQLAPLREHAFRPGQSGNPAGRPKGARSKLTTEFFADFYSTWQEHGAAALKKVATDSPRDFVEAAAMLMPKEFEIKTPLDEMSDAELGDLIAAVQSLIASGVALTPPSGERPAAKPE
jgi:hypothetical protein